MAVQCASCGRGYDATLFEFSATVTCVCGRTVFFRHERPTDKADDPYDLNRFLIAQKGVYEQALAELKDGRKRTHWMWFIFPQIEGLGFSPTARRYAIRGIDEARAYLAHPALGTRLVECTEAVLGLRGGTVSEIFGYPDDLKFRSSMTLFEQAAGQGSVFSSALDRYCRGERDSATLRQI